MPSYLRQKPIPRNSRQLAADMAAAAAGEPEPYSLAADPDILKAARTMNETQLAAIAERDQRAADAITLAAALWPHVAELGLTEGHQARDVVRGLDDTNRALVAGIAGTQQPDPATWAIVANLIAGRLEAR